MISISLLRKYFKKYFPIFYVTILLLWNTNILRNKVKFLWHEYLKCIHIVLCNHHLQYSKKSLSPRKTLCPLRSCSLFPSFPSLWQLIFFLSLWLLTIMDIINRWIMSYMISYICLLLIRVSLRLFHVVMCIALLSFLWMNNAPTFLSANIYAYHTYYLLFICSSLGGCLTFYCFVSCN